MQWNLEHILFVIGAYLLGSIPTGYLVARQVAGIDIREHGSGNTGATNVKRVVGNKAGLFVLICDFFKGLLPVLLSIYLYPEAYIVHILTALAAVVGHSKSIFLKFGGGKSAITGLGGIIGLAPLPGLILGAFAFTIIKITRIVSIGTMITAVVAPILLFVMDRPFPYIIYTAVTGLYVIYLHRANIERLIKGTENRI
jgi:acyl phosphate:glycerol-3-phosphate acyltransferase